MSGFPGPLDLDSLFDIDLGSGLARVTLGTLRLFR